MILTTYSDTSDVLVFTTESEHYCIIVRALKDIRLNDDGTLDARPVYGPFHNEVFCGETFAELYVLLMNIEGAGYQVPWEQFHQNWDKAKAHIAQPQGQQK